MSGFGVSFKRKNMHGKLCRNGVLHGNHSTEDFRPHAGRLHARFDRRRSAETALWHGRRASDLPDVKSCSWDAFHGSEARPPAMTTGRRPGARTRVALSLGALSA